MGETVAGGDSAANRQNRGAGRGQVAVIDGIAVDGGVIPRRYRSRGHHIIGQNDNWKDKGQPLQILDLDLAPAADNHSAIVMTFDAGAYTPTAATVSSGIQHDEIDFGVNNG